MSSPNFDMRRREISLVILHYTGMESGESARARLCDPDAKVSAHWLVWEDGRVEALVDEAKRAWHAGVGSWHGRDDVNSTSIGIEIVNGGHDHLVGGKLPSYPDVQIVAMTKLVKDILARHDLGPEAVIGHSDIAPGRKIDPGEHFPWDGLAAAGAATARPAVEVDRRVLFAAGDRDRGVALLQRGLAEIGYGIAVSGIIDAETVDVVAAFQRRWRPERVDGVVDVETLGLVSALSA